MKEAEYDAWLEGLEPGDEVIVETYNYHWRDSWTDYTIATVKALPEEKRVKLLLALESVVPSLQAK